MLRIINKSIQWVLPLVLVAWCAVLLAQKIDLPTADIGRHIKNGEIIVHAPWAEKLQVLRQNYYSYTETNRPFVNHHWLSGVIFYLVHEFLGFRGLSVFYIILVAASFYLFFRLAQKQAGTAVAAILAVLVLPIATSRAEIRPEGFTYLFAAVFFWLLWKARNDAESSAERRGSYKLLWSLPVLMFFWVNLHIGFIFGFLIFGAFWLEAFLLSFRASLRARNPLNIEIQQIRDPSTRPAFLMQKGRDFGRDDRLKKLTIIGILCLVAGLINPFFVKGLLYPLNIFRQYGYLVVENQSVQFLERLGMGTSLYFGLFKFLLILAGLSFAFRFIRQMKNWKEFPYEDFLLLGSVAVLAALAVRNFTVFSLLFLPITASNIKAIMPELKHPAYKILPIAVAIAMVIFGSFRFWESYKFKENIFGLGLMPGVEASADFFKANSVKGPVFNNYDIGGYLIYELYPEMRVFTDNRPEAYSVNHFQNDYIPAQQDNGKWVKLEELHNFNAIFFSHRDFTPWGQAFLISRVQDPQWAPVFVDSYNIIFVRRNEQNLALIKAFEIPKDRFGIIQNQ